MTNAPVRGRNAAIVLAGILAAAGSGYAVLTRPSLTVPIEEQSACQQAAKTYPSKKIECLARESLWDRAQYETVAYETMWIVIFTGALAFVGIIQGFLLGGQLELGRDEFNSTHRPRITVHAVEFISDPPDLKDGTETIGASLLCFNAGDNRAKRVEVRADILACWDLAVDVQRPVVASFKNVVSGVKLRFNVRSDRAVNTLRGDVPPTQCVGTIAYWDNSGVRRETGFCVELRNPDKPEWVEITHRPEHNYEY